MAYNTQLANRLRERLQELPNIEEKEMMGGLVFMWNDADWRSVIVQSSYPRSRLRSGHFYPSACMGIIKDELMCRIDPERHETEVERQGCRTMDFTHRPMKGYVLIDETGMKTREDFEHWVKLSLEFNSKAKASKRRKG